MDLFQLFHSLLLGDAATDVSHRLLWPPSALRWIYLHLGGVCAAPFFIPHPFIHFLGLSTPWQCEWSVVCLYGAEFGMCQPQSKLG